MMGRPNVQGRPCGTKVSLGSFRNLWVHSSNPSSSVVRSFSIASPASLYVLCFYITPPSLLMYCYPLELAKST